MSPGQISEALTAFENTISQFQERYMASGSIQAMQYAQGAEDGKSTHSGSSQTVQPSHSDFVADVEICARRSLSKSDHAYWTLYYKSCQVVAEPGDTELLAAHINSFDERHRVAVASIDLRMRTNLGARLLEVKVAPLNEYLKAVDVRAARRPKNRWSHLYGN